MAELETICNDEKAWTRYTGDCGDVCVYRRCPECGKYLKEGKVFTNRLTERVKLTGWICKKHGEVEPFYLRD